ncbi:MAG: hypothetical protein PWQ37_1128 [Candidatus Petromonas sp.]|jgi:hypothetical protein|nr:hypothetical protein [Candidatus Petromonas sp.]
MLGILFSALLKSNHLYKDQKKFEYDMLEKLYQMF